MNSLGIESGLTVVCAGGGNRSDCPEYQAEGQAFGHAPLETGEEGNHESRPANLGAKIVPEFLPVPTHSRTPEKKFQRGFVGGIKWRVVSATRMAVKAA